jgi:hypothetical protein
MYPHAKDAARGSGICDNAGVPIHAIIFAIEIFALGALFGALITGLWWIRYQGI